MTKRVAWFTSKSSNGAFTPNIVYEVFKESGESFDLIDNAGYTRFCLKKGCAHICDSDWVFADVVEEEVKPIVDGAVERVTPKKWSAWIPHTTDEQPVADDVIVKVKFCDGTKCKEEAGNWGWFKPEQDGDGAIRFYKVKLEDLDKIVTPLKPKSKWTKNTGVMPVDGDVVVMMKFSDGTIDRTQAQEYSWDFGQSRKIVKWRLAD